MTSEGLRPPDALAGHTRRWLLQAGAAGAVGVLGASSGWLVPAASAAEIHAEEVFPGELRLFAGDYVPSGWLGCVGQELAASDHDELAKALGGAFGGNEHDRFRLPDLRGRGLVGAGAVSGEPPRRVGEHGRGLVERSADNHPSSLALTYLISPEFKYTEPFIGEVRAFSFGQDQSPGHWLACDGRELAINAHTALYSVFGSRFGKTSSTMFALPDLRSATPVSHGDSADLPPAPFASRHLNLAPGGAGRHPRLHVNYCIAALGRYPSRT
jgi:microcystin-dependent protein